MVAPFSLMVFSRDSGIFEPYKLELNQYIKYSTMSLIRPDDHGKIGISAVNFSFRIHDIEDIIVEQS